LLKYIYPGAEIIFTKFKLNPNTPFTIHSITINGKRIDIGENRKLVLRSNDDLRKLDPIWDFQNASLRNCDLRSEATFLDSISFDNLTEWPPLERLPPGFNPDSLLESGKNPGLGVRKLHEQGITGKGVGIAIIDQPLLMGHKEYTSRIVRYDEMGLVDIPPQMHGSPVASIAVGKDIGVAPEAVLSYFAVPVWEHDNMHYVRILRRIFHLNAELPDSEKIRVVSISDGGFSSYPGFEEWREVLGEAERLGILVVTCDPGFLKYGTLKYVEGNDRDSPESYTAYFILT